MMLKIIILILAGLGVLGTLLPVLPGTPLIILAGVIHFLAAEIEAVTWPVIIGLIVMSLIAESIEYLFSILGARYFGATKRGIIGAIAGLIIGFIVLGPLGIVVGPFLGAIIIELISGRKFKEAVNVGLGTILGQLGGSVVSFLISLVMFSWLVIEIFQL